MPSRGHILSIDETKMHHLYEPSTTSVDERHGFRPGAPILSEVKPTPWFNLYCRFSPNGSSEPFDLLFKKPIETISRIWVKGVTITGVVGSHNVLALNLGGSLSTVQNTMSEGFPSDNTNVYLVNCGGAADVFYRPADPECLCVYRQLKRLESLQLRITNAITGDPVTYSDCVISLGLETESFLH